LGQVTERLRGARQILDFPPPAFDDDYPAPDSPPSIVDAEDDPKVGEPPARSPILTGRWSLIGGSSVRASTKEIDGGNQSRGEGTVVFRIDDNTALLSRNSLGEAWLFAPFIDPGIRNQKRSVSWCSGKTHRRVSSSSDPTASGKSQRELLITGQKSALRGAYAAVGSDLNLTSMMLLSTPVLSSIKSGEIHEWSPSQRITRVIPDGRVGWLGTGDSNLKNDRRRRSALNHYRRHLDRVHTLAIPHHGAENSFHPDVVRKLKPRLCVVAADRFSNWRHPATSVVQAIASAGIELRITTSAKASSVDELISI
jgi:hypothetical protein